MWMLLRRRRSALLIGVMLVVILCYVVFRDDQNIFPVRNALQLQKEAIQHTYFDEYDDDDDENGKVYATDEADEDNYDDEDNDGEHADIERDKADKGETPEEFRLDEKKLEELKEENENAGNPTKEKEKESENNKEMNKENEINKDVNKESETNKELNEEREDRETMKGGIGEKEANLTAENKGDDSGGTEGKKSDTDSLTGNGGDGNVPPKNERIEPSDNHKAHLVILAYMRTGSSMTGRILQYSPDVFYWYEPLHSLERYYVTGGKPDSKYRNKTLNEWFKSSGMAGGNISATVSCDIAHVYNLTLRDHFMTYGTYGTRLFHACFTRAVTPNQWKLCVEDMTSMCRWKFNATAVKSIRLHMSRALEVMRNDPKVKIVHLLRDPRAVLLSRYRLGFANFDKLDSEAALLCSKYTDDLNLAPRPGNPLRERYSLVRYEDIAAAPLNHTRHLYRMMDIEPTDRILNAISRMTEFAKKSKPCPTCSPVPLNSTEVSQAWRQTMELDDVQTISKECADVMKMLGYRVDFDNEAQLRDLRVSAVGPLKFV